MALKPCEQCKHAIRSEDRRCPHCGQNQPGASSHVGKVALVLFALGFGVWVFDATSFKEPEKQIAASAPPEAAPVQAQPTPELSELERTLQERCGKQTDDDGNWIVKGAENRARCRVQVELDLAREQREARLVEAPRAPAASQEKLAHQMQMPATAPHLANVSRFTKASRARALRHEPTQRSQPSPNAAAAAPAPSAPEPTPPAKDKGGFDPGDDLKPLVPAGGAVMRDPVPGEPMFVKPDAAFL